MSVTPHLLGLAPLAREMFGLTAGRLQILIVGETYFFLPASCLKQVGCKGVFGVFQGISRGIFDSASPRGMLLLIRDTDGEEILYKPPGE